MKRPGQNQDDFDPIKSSSDQVTLARLRSQILLGEMESSILRMNEQVSRLCHSLDLLERAERLGIEMVYPNRQEALHSFIGYLEKYLDRNETKLYIVGSSLKGALEANPRFRDVIRKAIPKDGHGSRELFVLLTHPGYSGFRENQEDRAAGDIADEIFYSIRRLRHEGLKEIKLYKGTPTCFMIATEDKMLLNPYPYEKPGYESFCLQITDVKKHPDNIYSQYWKYHFFEPWENRRLNALTYQYFQLEGPNPDEHLEEGPDVFLIQDAKEFYLAVFLRGKNGLPHVVAEKSSGESNGDPASASKTALSSKSPAVTKNIELGNEFTVELLRVSDDGKTCIWEPFSGKADFSTDRRRGKVIGTHSGDYKQFTMIGVFSKERDKYKNPHLHKAGWAPPGLTGQNLPLFWANLNK